MATYTIDGIVLRQSEASEILGIEPSQISFIVPDQETGLVTQIEEIVSEGEQLLRLEIDDNDILLDGRSIYSINELDFSIVTVESLFPGSLGKTVILSAFENDLNAGHIFRIGGAPLPPGAFLTPDAAETFIAAAEIRNLTPGSGFAPSEVIDLAAVPDVSVEQNDFVIDNRNDEEANRSYALGIGEDVFEAGAGSDTVDGGADADILSLQTLDGDIFANLTDTAREGLAPGEVRHASGSDQVTSFENVLDNGFSSRIFLPDGAGFVFDRAGDDYIEGDAGDTNFIPGSGQDTLIGGSGADALLFLDDGFDGAGEVVQGVALTMSGAGEGTVIDGWGFTDTFTGISLFEGSVLDDMFEGADGADTFFGALGDDTLMGGGGRDNLFGGAGADLLDGGAGRDIMEGGAGDDVFRVDDTRDIVIENPGEGIDRIEATRNVVLRSSEIEVVELFDSAVRITGNGVATEMIGNDRSNVLIGGGGDDMLEGRAGNDFFAFLVDDALGTALIVDFEAGDRIALDDQFFGLGDSGIDVRDVTQKQISNAVRNGLAQYDERSGTLSIDVDGRSGPAKLGSVLQIEGGGRFTPDELLLF